MQHLVSRVFEKVVREHFADSPLDGSRVPAIFPPADEAMLDDLQRRFGGFLDPTYREFLSVTDGMVGGDIDILGARDWVPGGRSESAMAFRDILEGTGTAQDVGAPEGVSFFPVASDEFSREAIFMIDLGSEIPYRFWWVGAGSSRFFGGFHDVLEYVVDPSAYDPVEEIE
ncbi:SMI1/KNR4 family protein [Streptomyces sp. NPDC015232]|uniref:SMI1/KNR4 family protein n=1 Tax=unclassified Streptomyces TaxID=2593676 RepID=UPI0033D433EC